MASEAYDRAMKRQQAPTEAELAALIMQDVSQLSENAEAQGVTAYLRKPVHRERPNERFLQGTLRSVAFANRKAEEDEMWTRRKRRRSSPQGLRSDREQQDGDSSWESVSGQPTSAEASSDSQEPGGGAVTDAELAELLSKRRVRGRGAVGSRVDEPGPFLPESARAEEGPDDLAAPRALGPERPAWLQIDPQDDSANGAVPRSRDTVRDREIHADDKADSQERQKKRKKKKKKEKRHKEKIGRAHV